MGSVDSHSVVACEVPHAELFWLAPVAAGGVCGYAGGSSWLNPGGAGGSAELKRDTQRLELSFGLEAEGSDVNTGPSGRAIRAEIDPLATRHCQRILLL